MPYKNKEDLYAKQLEHRTKNRERLFAYLLCHPCVDCGEDDPVVLEFDHVNEQKSFNIGRAVSGSHRSWAKILAEIEKCEVRCANCHRKRTSQQFGWYRHAMPH